MANLAILQFICNENIRNLLPRPKISSHMWTRLYIYRTIRKRYLPSHAKATTASNKVDNFENESVVKTYSSLDAICFNSDNRKLVPIPMATMVTFCFFSRLASC